MFLPITELMFHGVYDHGKPNLERVVLRPVQAVNLGEYSVSLGVRVDAETITPIHNLCYWFLDRRIEPPSWIMLYTGKGEDRESVWQKTGERVYTRYWGLEFTVFKMAVLQPIVFHHDAIAVPHAVPQIASNDSLTKLLNQSE